MKRNNKIGKQDATAFLFDAKGKDGVDGGGFASKQAGKKATPRSNRRALTMVGSRRVESPKSMLAMSFHPVFAPGARSFSSGRDLRRKTGR